ncbi:branched-chain amino acid ABC transporter permease [Halogeometricum luteum]|uniref:Branched-chain amino acid ABC transporter permease n=1 Tax=Halogeometricum luteum TaxID=2950537 RepID=A0ABU2G4J5_9EURY|nr:branched-chain amino acid ABC transporter permease [Halogeometricum sp. S3BR5-2]MDS0295722.1 branched-chain amino acid ABC transporter permease [Halogeometricum sp. S3BR5-2]
MSGQRSPTSIVNRISDAVPVDSVSTLQVPLGLLAIVIFIRPVVSHPLLLGYEQIANTILIWMLFAVAFNLLIGYSGLLSFGHAMFLGIGAYGAAIGTLTWNLPFLLSAAIGITVATLLGYLLGRLTVARGEIYFAMLTLAFAQSIYFIANQNYGGLTGGSTGISGALPAWIESYRGVMYVSLGWVSFDWYYLLATVFVVAGLLLWQLVRSPFGRTLAALRENEQLARAVGIDVKRYKVWAFTLSAAFTALAGVLLEINNQGATLHNLSINTSGDIILMTILGGTNYFLGPAAGAFVWLFAEDFLTEFEMLVLPLSEFPIVTIELSGVLAYWQFFLGLLFVAAVLVAPREGLWGLCRGTLERLYDRINGDQTKHE